jgi:hypothetical protein
VRASYDALVELFERIESFFKNFGVYTQISFTLEMAEVVVKIAIEVLSILSIATKEVNRRRSSMWIIIFVLGTYSPLCFIRNIFWETVRKGRY